MVLPPSFWGEVVGMGLLGGTVMQGGPVLVINGVITSINGIING